MTEEEWLACAEPAPIMDYLPDRVTDRKWRLFGVACCRRIWNKFTDERSRNAVEVAERDEAPVALHKADRLFWRAAYDSEDPEIEMADGGRFDVADVQLEVIGTAGHTPGSVSLYCQDLDVVFTGDALSASGPVPHEGSFAEGQEQRDHHPENPDNKGDFAEGQEEEHPHPG